jgi:hypothetical protein
MSRQNKVNPGMYTQRGRLTQDDAARELRKQSAVGSPHTWQPVNTKTRPRRAPAAHAAHGTGESAAIEMIVDTSRQTEARRASPPTRNKTATNAAGPTAKDRAAKTKTAKIRTSKRTPGKAKAGAVAATAVKRTTTKPTRGAERARNVRRRTVATRSTTKGRKG